jgi:hypothetical protein
MLGQVEKIAGDDIITIPRRNFRRFTRSIFQRSMNIGGAQSVFASGLEIMLVGGDHHDFLGFQIEQLRRE